MGWSLSGIAISENFEKDTRPILKMISAESAKPLENITFDEASMHFWPDEKLTIGFFGNGTLVFCGTALITNDELLTKASLQKNIVAFYVNDNNSTYCFDFFSNGNYKRRKWVSDTDDAVNDTGVMGEPLEYEDLNGDNQEEVFKIIEKILGLSLYDISEDEVMYQFQL